MKIYVGTYHKYNCGSLFGEWVDITDFADKDDFLAYCAELHKDEEDPEFMFQDYEDIPECFISESWVSELLWNIPDYIDIDAFEAFVSNYGVNIDDEEVFEQFERAFCGEWKDEEDFVYEEFRSIYEIPDFLEFYIDWEKIARDWFCGKYSFVDGYVFRDNW